MSPPANTCVRISVTQSAASRFEGGRPLPKTVQLLLHVAYAEKKDAMALFRQLRDADALDAGAP